MDWGSIFNGEKWTGGVHLTQGGQFSTAKSGPGGPFSTVENGPGGPFRGVHFQSHTCRIRVRSANGLLRSIEIRSICILSKISVHPRRT